jgi:hypothetical protein
MLYIFIDESGIHKETGKSSVALAYISFENLSKIQDQVIKIEKEIGIEFFHWAHSSWAVRNKFFEKIAKCDFSVKVVLIQNPFNNQSYEYALQHLIMEKNISAIIIDGKKKRSYERKLKKVLRDKGISVKKLKTGNDQSYPALRIADAVAGIVRYRNDNFENKNALPLYNLIKNKILITLEE